MVTTSSFRKQPGDHHRSGTVQGSTVASRQLAATILSWRRLAAGAGAVDGGYRMIYVEDVFNKQSLCASHGSLCAFVLNRASVIYCVVFIA